MKPDELHRIEARYSNGGERVVRRKVSPLDPRGQKPPGSMLSGTRMTPGRGYAQAYCERLADYVDRRFVLVELGVLLGSGLALWCDVFPKARVIGLDIDPKRFAFDVLKRRRAFQHNRPEVYYFDELADDAHCRVGDIFGDELIDVFIDDGLHDDASILGAMKAVKPYLAPQCFYFIEDNKTVSRKVAGLNPDFKVTSVGELTVCSRCA